MKDLPSDSQKLLFNQLYDTYCSRVYNYVMMMSHGNTYLADEITQITFLKVWEHISVLNDYDHLKAYILHTARNYFLNLCNQTTVREVYATYIRQTRTEAESTTENEVERHAMEQFLENMVSCMAPIRQQVFRMNKMEGKSVQEISENLGIAPKTVENHLYLAMKFIKQCFIKRYGADAASMIMTICLILS